MNRSRFPIVKSVSEQESRSRVGPGMMMRFYNFELLELLLLSIDSCLFKSCIQFP